jgi:hypothetical protein
MGHEADRYRKQQKYIGQHDHLKTEFLFCALAGLASRGRTNGLELVSRFTSSQPAAKGDHEPDTFDQTKRPCTLKKSIN